MAKLSGLFDVPISSRQFDASLPRWVGFVVGLAVMILVSATFPRQAGSNEELLLGMGLGVLMFLFSLLFGTMLGWLERSLLKRPMPHRHRIGEYISYGSFRVVFGVGLLVLSTLPLTKPGFMIGILLILSVSLAVICVGICSSLMRLDRE